MKRNQVYVGNNLEILKTFPDNSIDSIVTDPPYGLGKEPNAVELLQSWITTGYHEVKGKGFMGKEWDAFVPQPLFWKECFRVLKHGGHLLSFAGTRTYDWVVMGLRLSGFEIRDQIAWVYGSGFPKSMDVAKAIDKIKSTTIDESLYFAKYIKDKRIELGITLTEADKIVCNSSTNYSWYEGRKDGQRLPNVEDYQKIKKLLNLDDRFDDLIGSAEREIIGTYIRTENSGGIPLQGKRNLVELEITKPSTEQAKQWQGWGTALKPALEPIVMARKPLIGTVAQNVLEHGTGGINIDGCRVETDDKWQGKDLPNAKDGVTWGGALNSSSSSSHPNGRFPANFIHDGSDEVVKLFPSDGEDSAARFFYTAKASQTERNWGLEGFKEDVTTDGRKKSIDNAFNRGETKRKNIHPTVKPLDLMKYLVRLVTPKNGVCLDPFLGSGTTAVACKSEKLDFIGIELMPEYAKIAEARIKAETVFYDIYDFLGDDNE